MGHTRRRKRKPGCRLLATSLAPAQLAFKVVIHDRRCVLQGVVPGKGKSNNGLVQNIRGGDNRGCRRQGFRIESLQDFRMHQERGELSPVKLYLFVGQGQSGERRNAQDLIASDFYGCLPEVGKDEERQNGKAAPAATGLGCGNLDFCQRLGLSINGKPAGCIGQSSLNIFKVLAGMDSGWLWDGHS
jgi:hypothetical protein